MTLPSTTQTTTVTVGGHAYRVNSSATDEQLQKLAAIVDERLLALPLAQRGDPKSLVLVALGLAHDLEQEQRLRIAEREESTARILGLVNRIDDALGHVDHNGDALEPVLLPSTRHSPPATAANNEAPVPVVVRTHPLPQDGKRGRSPST